MYDQIRRLKNLIQIGEAKSPIKAQAQQHSTKIPESDTKFNKNKKTDEKEEEFHKFEISPFKFLSECQCSSFISDLKNQSP